MPIEVVFLALASAVRPSTSLAAVYGLLALPRARVLLAVFIAVGLAFSVAVGVVIVIGLGGFNPPGRDERFRAFIDVIVGVAAIAYGAGVWSGRATRLTRHEHVQGENKWTQRVRRHATVRGAAVLGAVTHVPGLFYIVALDAIAARSPSATEALFAVLVYNAIWFSLPVAAWAASDRAAPQVRQVISRINDWARRNEQALVAAVFAAVGVFLLFKGLSELV